MPAYKNFGGFLINYYGEVLEQYEKHIVLINATPKQPHRHNGGNMTEEQLEQLKQDPNLELSFTNNNKKDLASLYRIYLKIETKQPTTEKEKEVYGVEFKKGQTLKYPINIATNYNDELIYIINDYSKLPFSDFCKSIFFDNFESARKYLELNIQQQINKAK